MPISYERCTIAMTSLSSHQCRYHDLRTGDHGVLWQLLLPGPFCMNRTTCSRCYVALGFGAGYRASTIACSCCSLCIRLLSDSFERKTALFLHAQSTEFIVSYVSNMDEHNIPLYRYETFPGGCKSYRGGAMSIEEYCFAVKRKNMQECKAITAC